jgi:HEAT repeat protein
MLKNRIRITLSLLLLAGIGGGCTSFQAEDDGNPITKLIQKLLPEDPAQKRQRLLQNLSSPDADLRREGVLMLAEDEPSTWDVTLDILALMSKGDSEPQVRAAAVQVHSKLDQSETLSDVLPRAARDRSPLVRRECIKALRTRNDEESLEVLLNFLANDPEGSLRAEAAVALENYRYRKAVLGLAAALDDDEFAVIFRSRQSLLILTGKDFQYDRSEWEDWIYSAGDPFALK